MADVYSQRLFTGRINLAVGASSTLVTAPAGKTLLIYQVSLFNPGAATKTDTRLRVVPSGGAAVAYAAFDIATLKSESRTERLVLEEGDALQLRATTAGDYDVNVFGQELTNEP